MSTNIFFRKRFYSGFWRLYLIFLLLESLTLPFLRFFHLHLVVFSKRVYNHGHKQREEIVEKSFGFPAIVGKCKQQIPKFPNGSLSAAKKCADGSSPLRILRAPETVN